ncbi:Arylsulfatase [Pontiella desulfatans]|uniref:Arylsulfatase n=2 Tax=Pontiella desulfatans TaxID=2750659 RepID=A0A6C2U044_PONDE|nr:sulfatase S1_4 [Kiritimatiellales bacterium]VGO13320.1 Arylsulfatase [Pontiella desulfatans]
MKHWLTMLCMLMGLGSFAERPNVMIVLFDDLGFSDLGCYGGEIPTPNIDRLGNNGLRFTRMTNSARCCPSRASLMTGLHPGQTGIPNFGGALVEDCATLGEVMRGAGYQTYAVGKWHVGHVPTDRGFDEFYGYPAGHSQDQWSPGKYVRLPKGREPEIKVKDFYATDVFTEYALEFLKQAEKKDTPWFMYLAHSSPHFPLQAPIESVKPFVDTYRKGWDVLRSERFEKLKRIGLAEGEGWALTDRSVVPVEQNNQIANGYSGEPNPAWNDLDTDLREDLAHRMALYAAMVRHVDDGIGRIVEQLKKTGDYENTVIMVLSDNGACYEWGPLGFDKHSRAGITKLHTVAELETIGGPGSYISGGSAWANLCNTPFRMYKHYCHEGGIVTPFIVHWPKGVEAPGRWVRDSAHIVDIMSTMVDVSGARYPESVQPMEGVSLAPLFRPGNALNSRTLCYQHFGARAIQKGTWKMVKGNDRYPNKNWELFDLSADPCETKDLAAKHPELVATLEREWDAWAKRTKAMGSGNKPKKNGNKKKKG